MAGNNLRIIYNNIVDASNTLTATNTNTNYIIDNVKKDTKGLVWRTNNASTSSNIRLSWATAQTISAVILPYTNLSATATITITLYSDAAFATQVFTSGAVAAVPAVLENQSTATANYRYAFGGGNCARVYFTQTANCRSMQISIVDTANTDTYLEVSRIIVGTYWSPLYNTEFGLAVGIDDSSTKIRTQTGNLVTDIGTSNKTLTFNLSYMVNTDRDILFNIIRTIGTRKSIYVSLFPQDSEPTKEQTYQVYGRLSDLATITNPMYSIYASSISIEEV
jgi:hypothetical protein